MLIHHSNLSLQSRNALLGGNDLLANRAALVRGQTRLLSLKDNKLSTNSVQLSTGKLARGIHSLGLSKWVRIGHFGQQKENLHASVENLCWKPCSG